MATIDEINQARSDAADVRAQWDGIVVDGNVELLTVIDGDSDRAAQELAAHWDESADSERVRLVAEFLAGVRR